MSKNVEIDKESMADYLDRIGAGKVLISREPLSYDWTPSELVGRKDELADLASMFFGIENHNVSCRAVITGNVGSGKTVLTRRFCIGVSESALYPFLNRLERVSERVPACFRMGAPVSENCFFCF